MGVSVFEVSVSPTKTKQLLDTFTELDSFEQQLLKHFSVSFSSWKVPEFYAFLIKINVSPSTSKKFTVSELRPIMTKLTKLGYFTTGHFGYVLSSPQLNDQLFKKFFNEHDDPVAIIDKATTFWISYFEKLNKYRLLRHAIFQKQWNVVDLHLDSRKSFFGRTFGSSQELDFFWSRFFDFDLMQEYIHEIPQSLLSVIFPYICNNVVDSLRPLDPLISTIENLYKANSLPVDNQWTLVDTLIHAGKFSLALEISSKNAVLSNYTNGIIATLSGDHTQAVEYFTAVLPYYRKSKNRKSGFICQLGGYLFIVSLLRCNNLDCETDALKYTKLGSANTSDDLWQNMYIVMYQHLQKHFDNVEINSKAYYLNNNFLDYSTPLEYCWALIALKTTNPGRLKDTPSENLISALRKTGYIFLAWEIASIFKELQLKNSFYQQEYKELSQQFSYETTIPFVKDIEPWEQVLHALTRLNSTEETKSKSKEKNKRVIWQFTGPFEKDSISPNNYFIEPIEQTITKSGKWSKGKKIAAKRYQSEYQSNTFLSDFDKKMATVIVEDDNYWNYNKQYKFSLEKAAPYLIDADTIFDETGKIQLSFTKANIQLKAQKTQSGLKVSIAPSKIRCHYRAAIEQDTNSHFRIYLLTPNEQNIIETIAQPFTVPLKGVDAFSKSLSTLSNKILINSNLKSLDIQIETVDADQRAIVLLHPYFDGIKASIRFKPLEDGPYFRPNDTTKKVIITRDNKKVQAIRNLKKEQELANKILDATELEHDSHSQEYFEWAFEDPEESLDFLHDLKTISSDEIVLEWPKGERFSITKTVNFDSLTLRLNKERDWFSIDGEVKISDSESLTITQILELIKRDKSRFIRINDKDYLALTNSLYQKLQDLKNYTNLESDELLIHPLASLQIGEFSNEGSIIKGSKIWKDYFTKFNKAQNITPAVPKAVKATLRDYQVVGYHWLCRLAEAGIGACLADDMGLGKTLQCLAVMQKRATKGPSLIVAPASVCHNWIGEAEKFTPALEILFYNEATDRQAILNKATKKSIVVTSYGLVQQNADDFKEVNWNVIVLDEAQAIKNRMAKRSRAVMGLTGEFKVISTGTPLENHLGELWNLFQFINPQLLGSINQFALNYIAPIEREKNQQVADSLRKLIHPFILRRTKEQVLTELPPRTEILLSVDMSRDETLFYEALRQNAIKELEEEVTSSQDAGRHRMMILSQITKLRQACCNPRLVLPETPIQSSKLAVFGEKVEELIDNNHRALVFSQFVSHLEILREYLDDKGINYQYLDGQTPLKKRQEAVEAFQNGDGEIFLISLKAGGTGLNLTAADYVIHMDPWWNPAVEDQASDRAYRIGQDKPVTIYRIVTRNTIEEKIVKLHQDKRDLADNLLEGGNVSGKLDTEELMNLLNKM